MGALAFAHVGAAADLTLVLRAGRVDPTTQLEQARFVPFRRVGHDVVEKIIEAFRLDIL